MTSPGPGPIGLDPFVSELARSWMRESPEVFARELSGSLVFADISGFTRLTERLAARGRFGAEEMSDHLDRVLSELLSASYEYGGWLVKWGGDALLLMFEGDAHVVRACAASAAMQARMRRIGLLDSSVGRVRLRMSIGVHTGTFAFHLLGHRHRELFITGDAATRTARLEATAEAGEILVSPELAGLLPGGCVGVPKEPGVLLARTPSAVLPQRRDAVTADVTGLVPELVLEHLARGGGTGEHRPVTIAFLEFSGLAQLHADGGAVAVDDALRHLVEVTQEACHRYTVSFHETDISPDGGKVMLVAGAPRALEDPAEAMLCTLRQVLDEHQVFSLRAGVTTGRAFTGVVGPLFRRSYSVKGDVVNLAARIMGKTPPGGIWALPAVVDASRTRFVVAEVPPFTVKGKVAPVHVRAIGAPLPRAETNADLPLVGRADELAALRRALDDARAGDGRHVDLVGPPGIGKTRLLAELIDAAGEMAVLRHAAELYRAAAAYSLARPVVLGALGVADVPAADLPATLTRWCVERAPAALPWLPLLGAVVGATFDPSPQTADLAPEFRAERLHALVLDLLTAALPGPTLLTVDDMQFADEASEELLRHLARNAAGRSWLVVLAGREPGAEQHQGPASEVLVVGPLDVAEAHHLVAVDTDEAPLGAHITAAVVDRAGGNPLFLRQLAASAQGMADGAELPDSVETVVAARIDQLRPAARDLLRVVAVAGMSVDRDVLTELLADEPIRLAAVGDELDEFLAVDESRLRFRQVVIRDAAYEGLAFRRRAALHGRMAALLIARHVGDTTAIDAVLSVHHLHAGEYVQALRAARAAGDRAAAAYANAEAALLYARAVTAAGRVSDPDAAVRAELLERLGDVQVLLGEHEAADRSYSAATTRRRNDRVALGRIALKRARSAVRRGAFGLALSRLRRVARTLDGVEDATAVDLRLEAQMVAAFVQARRGRLAAARSTCLTIVNSADETRNASVLADALTVLDVLDVNVGSARESGRADRALQLLERRGDLGGQARVLTQMGYRAYLDGRWNDAVASYQRARQLVERLGDLSNVAIADANIAEIRLDQGRLDEAESSLREAVHVWRASASVNDAAFGQALLGRVLARQGRFDESQVLLEQARARFVEQDARTEVVDADTYRAESLLLQGRPGEALALAQETLAAAARLAEHPVQAPLLHRIIGGCHDASGDVAAGDAAFDRALEVARGRGADHELAFTVSAMVGRVAVGGRPVDPVLVAEVEPLQRRLGLVLDLVAAERRARPVVVPMPRSDPDAVSV